MSCILNSYPITTSSLKTSTLPTSNCQLIAFTTHPFLNTANNLSNVVASCIRASKSVRVLNCQISTSPSPPLSSNLETCFICAYGSLPHGPSLSQFTTSHFPNLPSLNPCLPSPTPFPSLRIIIILGNAL